MLRQHHHAWDIIDIATDGHHHRDHLSIIINKTHRIAPAVRTRRRRDRISIHHHPRQTKQNITSHINLTTVRVVVQGITAAAASTMNNPLSSYGAVSSTNDDEEAATAAAAAISSTAGGGGRYARHHHERQTSEPIDETQPLFLAMVRKVSEPVLRELHLRGMGGGGGGGGGDHHHHDDHHHHTHDRDGEFVFGNLVRKVSEPFLQDLSIIRHSSFVLNEHLLRQQAQERQFSGTATIVSEVANMTKNLIGGGVLSLSGGIAVYSNNPQAVVPAMLWTAFFGAILGYFCLLIGKSCQMTFSSTYRECWERTVGHRGGLTVAIVNTLDPLLGIFANASILSQSLQLLLMGIFDIYWSSVECLLCITMVAILPLCLMKNLNALAPYSALGMVAVLAALGAMTVRYWDGSYLPGGKYFHDTPPTLSPSFGTEPAPWCSLALLPFICMVYTSFDMHYNSPRFYSELANASVPRFTQVVAYSFGITAAIYSAIGMVGFLTFGENCDSYILNNYSPRDSLATLGRLAIGLCSLVSYPLNFIGVRDNCLDILGVADQVNTPAKLNAFTIVLLMLLTITSCFVSDLGLINSVGGGTTVTLVCFIFPALMFREGTRHSGGGFEGSGHGQRRRRREIWIVMILTVFGVMVGLVGVWASLFYGA